MLQRIGALLFLITVSLFNPSAYAEGLKTVEVSAVGYGATRDDAIKAGLANAVGQVNGTSLESRQASESVSIASSIEEQGKAKTSASVKMDVARSTALETSGQVDGYDIVNVAQEDDGTFKVDLNVRVFRYDLAQSTKRKKVAVIPPQSQSNYYNIFGGISAQNASKQLYTELEKNLVQSRKFAVLTRTQLKQIDTELAIINSERTSRTEKAKLGRGLGADFLLTSKIIAGNGSSKTKTIEITGQTKTTTNGGLRIAVQVLSPITGEIKFSDEFVAYIDRPNRDYLFRTVARKAITAVVEQIYPMRIIGTENDNFIINAGGKSLKKGTYYDVFQEGQQLVDPYTGESLGKSENKVGIVKITRVLPKVTYAKVISGEDIVAGTIIRKSKYRPASTAKSADKKQAAQQRPTTGYKLPFD